MRFFLIPTVVICFICMSCKNQEATFIKEDNLVFSDKEVKIYLEKKQDEPVFHMKIGSRIFSNVDGEDPMYYKNGSDYYIFEYPEIGKDGKKLTVKFSFFYIYRYNKLLNTCSKFGPFEIHYVFSPKQDEIIPSRNYLTIRSKNENCDYSEIIFNLKNNCIACAVPRSNKK